MKKYLICIDKSSEFNASSKARKDAEIVMLNNGYQPIEFDGDTSAERNRLKQIELLFKSWENWKKLEKTAEQDSIVVVQYPHYPLKSSYIISHLLPKIKRKKRFKFVALIHDLNSLRGMYGKPSIYSDNTLLPLFDMIICHNESMKEYLEELGIDEDKLVSLELFDYLNKATPKKHKVKDGIAIAGNLDPEKSGYISKFIKMYADQFPIHLYGKGLEETSLPDNVIYHGMVDSDDLPSQLEGAFGLVWDGDSLATCNGLMGNYLKFNNPHKASLYLASGLPVIAWSGAAISKLIEKEKLGITVESLKSGELNINISEDDYILLLQNVDRFRKKINSQMLTKALENVEKRYLG